jgi:hypothetical protein
LFRSFDFLKRKFTFRGKEKPVPKMRRAQKKFRGFQKNTYKFSVLPEAVIKQTDLCEAIAPLLDPFSVVGEDLALNGKHGNFLESGHQAGH